MKIKAIATIRFASGDYPNTIEATYHACDARGIEQMPIFQNRSEEFAYPATSWKAYDCFVGEKHREGLGLNPWIQALGAKAYNYWKGVAEDEASKRVTRTNRCSFSLSVQLHYVDVPE